jgi:hypothetical protein
MTPRSGSRARSQVACVGFPEKDRIRIVFADLGTVTMPSQYLVPVVYVQQPVAPPGSR